MCKVLIGIWGVLWLTTASPAFSQDTLFEMTFTADKNEITIGDEVTLAVDVLHGVDFKLLPLPKKLSLAPFEVKKIAQLVPKTGGQATTQGFRVVVTIFELGEFTIPKFPVNFVDPNGKKGVVYTDEWPVTVLSVGVTEKDTGDIRPLKGPKSLEYIWSSRRLLQMAAWAVLGGIILLFLLRYLWGRLKSWKQDRRTPYERALDDLKELEEAKLIESGQAKLYFTKISDILKLFLVKQFDVGSMDHTTREFMKDVRSEKLILPEEDTIASILKESDFVKFAKFIPPTTESQEMLTMTRQVVESTMTRFKAQKEPEALQESPK